MFKKIDYLIANELLKNCWNGNTEALLFLIKFQKKLTLFCEKISSSANDSYFSLNIGLKNLKYFLVVIAKLFKKSYRFDNNRGTRG